jgi:iron complex transport system substrate-binding protein
VAARIAGVAAALGAPARGETLVQGFWPEWRATQEAVKTYRTHPRVLFILAHGGGGALTGGRGTAAEAMIRLAGGVNAGDGTQGYQPLTTESVVLARPDVLLVTREGVGQVGGLEALWKHPALYLTPAGQARRAVVMDSLYLLGFGPRLPQAVRELARRLREGEPA